MYSCSIFMYFYPSQPATLYATYAYIIMYVFTYIKIDVYYDDLVPRARSDLGSVTCATRRWSAFPSCFRSILQDMANVGSINHPYLMVNHQLMKVNWGWFLNKWIYHYAKNHGHGADFSGTRRSASRCRASWWSSKLPGTGVPRLFAVPLGTEHTLGTSGELWTNRGYQWNSPQLVPNK